MKKLFLFIIITLLVKPIFAASINGYVLDSNNYQPIENIIVYAQRTEPNAWENFTLTDYSDARGSFSIQDLPIGTYRLSTNWTEEYFSSYYEIYIEITDPEDQIHYVDLLMDAVITSRGSISGHVRSELMSMEDTFFGLQIIQNSGPGEYDISQGFINIDENGYFEKTDLNIGLYKVGLFFYGEFNGIVWYENSFDEESATQIEITPEIPIIDDINFNIGYNSLNTSYVVVEDVIVDSGFDDQLDFAEEFEFSIELKNLSQHDAIDSNVYLWSSLGFLDFEYINLSNFNLASNESIIIGPFTATIDPYIQDQQELGIHYSYTLDNNLGIINDEIIFIANAPVINITETYVEALPEENMYSARVFLKNTGNASMQYPILNVSSNNSNVEFDQDYTEFYYLFIEDDGILDFNYEFYYDGLESEIDFIMNITSLSSIYDKDYEFSLTLQNPTDNEVVEVSKLYLKNYPNPFSLSKSRNSQTIISFNLNEDNFTNLEIFNLKGQKVKTLVNQSLTKGEYSVSWNGKDDSEKIVSAGVYFYKLRNGKYSKTKKMLLIK